MEGEGGVPLHPHPLPARSRHRGLWMKVGCAMLWVSSFYVRCSFCGLGQKVLTPRIPLGLTYFPEQPPYSVQTRFSQEFPFHTWQPVGSAACTRCSDHWPAPVGRQPLWHCDHVRDLLCVGHAPDSRQKKNKNPSSSNSWKWLTNINI